MTLRSRIASTATTIVSGSSGDRLRSTTSSGLHPQTVAHVEAEQHEVRSPRRELERLYRIESAIMALAEALDAPIVTCDGPLAKAPGHRATIDWIV